MLICSSLNCALVVSKKESHLQSRGVVAPAASHQFTVTPEVGKLTHSSPMPVFVQPVS